MSDTKWLEHPSKHAAEDEVTADLAADWREPPEIHLPKVPADFAAIPSIALRGHRPMKAEIAAAKRAVEEVAAMTDWEALFGITAPPRSLFTERVGLALRWSRLLAELLPLVVFVKSRTGSAWREALAVTADLKVPFDLAAKASPACVEPLPGLRALLSAQRNVAKRAVASRLRNAAAKLETSSPTPHDQEDR